MKRSFAILLALITLLVGCLPALADVDPANIDPSTKGSLHIVKYEYNTDPSYATATGGTGASSQTVPSGATVLGGVEFSLYKIGELSSYFAEGGAALPTPTEAASMISGVTPVVKTTSATGTADFANLGQGVYYVVESNAPARVTTRTAPFVVTIPMTNPEGTAWMYDVYVYPKNAATYGNVTIIKTGKDDAPLAGAKFKLQKYDTDLATPAWVDVGDLAATDSEGKATAEGLYANMNYRLIETAAPVGYVVDATTAYYFKIGADGKIATCDESVPKTGYPVSANTTTINAGEINTITINNPPQTVDKVITGGGKTTTGSVGSDVSFDITTTAPPSIKDLESFYLVDTLSAGLTYKSLAVAGMTENTEYTVTQSGQKVTVTFDPTKLTANQAITVTLVATINDSAVVGTAGNPNEVELVYDHSTDTGNQPGEPVTPPEDPKVYVAQVVLNKVDPSGNPLNGATFLLQKKVGTTWTDVETIVGTETSTFTFKKLGAGDYRLVEKQAPKDADGKPYNLLKDPIEFTLTFNETDKTFTNSNSGFTRGTDGGTFTIQVKNSRGFDLPKTGGMGTILYTVPVPQAQEKEREGQLNPLTGL